MKTWIRRSLIGVAVATITLGGLAACGHRSHGAGGGFSAMSEADQAEWRTRMVDRAAGKLDLDAAQKAKLMALAEAVATERLAVAGDRGQMRTELQSLIAGPSFDRTKAQTLVASKTQAMQVAAPRVITAFGDFYDSLKPEQQQKLREFMDRRGGRRGADRG